MVEEILLMQVEAVKTSFCERIFGRRDADALRSEVSLISSVFYEANFQL